MTMEYSTFPSTTPSGRPVTVMVRTTFHPLGAPVVVAKLRDDAEMLPSVGSFDTRLIVTGDVGAFVRPTLKVAVPPLSVVTRYSCGEIQTFELSLSRMVAG